MSAKLQSSRGIHSTTYTNHPTRKMMFKQGLAGTLRAGIGVIPNRTYRGGPSGIYVPNNYNFPCYCVNYTLTSRNKFSLVK